MNIHKTLGNYKGKHFHFYVGWNEKPYKLFGFEIGLTPSRARNSFTFFNFSYNWDIYFGSRRIS